MQVKGIFWDESRKKYRLRLYKNGNLWHLSFHKSYDEALQTYMMLRSPDQRTQNPTSLMDLAFRLKLYYTKGV